jgi:hypothetical protein
MEWPIHKLVRLRPLFLQNSKKKKINKINGMLVQGQNQYEYKK